MFAIQLSFKMYTLQQSSYLTGISGYLPNRICDISLVQYYRLMSQK